ncbi:transporter substrate-binding domain-containing protein [Oxalobacteraceae bacterium]|nr:transporter substrate-binding domain-containing protein [Oxalobacteraceae bacterium]
MFAQRRTRTWPRLRLLHPSLLLCAALAGWPCLVHASTIYMPRGESVEDERGDFAFELLNLALKKSGADLQVKPTETRMPQSRAIVELAAGNGRVHIVATMTSRQRERQLLPIRIPLTRGLIGWRIALLRAEQRDLLRDVRLLSDLKHFSVAQGHDWPDMDILHHNGLNAYPVANYDGLFGMLKAGRIDWLPRSANEIWGEAARHPTLAIDPYLVLHYPAADYFFVNRNNAALAEQVRRGLELALADGSYEQLFLLHYGALIRRANFDQRRVIELSNPLLTRETPLARKELWFTLNDLKRYRQPDKISD